jgi:RecJ-like exonuclease
MATSPYSGTQHQPPDHLKPGDQAAPDTVGAGEDLCEDCGGTGLTQDRRECPTCEGSGRVMHGIGGG